MPPISTLHIDWLTSSSTPRKSSWLCDSHQSTSSAPDSSTYSDQGTLLIPVDPKEIVDPAEHHGLDKVRLSYDFQELDITQLILVDVA